MAAPTPNKFELLLKYGLPVGGNILGGIGNALLSSRTGEQKTAYRTAMRTQKDLERGITTGDVAGAVPMISKAALPGINQAVAKASGRFGSSSRRVAGAQVSAANRFAGTQMADFYRLMLQNNQQNKRMIYGTNMQAAAIG